MIYDCFTFFNELDILEIRLFTLSSVVDRFVLVESPYTHSGKEKKLFYDEVKNSYPYSEFKDKIYHVVYDSKPAIDRWINENEQRKAISIGLEYLSSDDVVMISDVDEIINPNVVKDLQSLQEPHRFVQKLYYYYFNCIVENCEWYHSVCCKGKDFNDAQEMRMRKITSFIESGGWHYSYLGSPSEIEEKIHSFAHSEYDTEYYFDKNHIQKCINEKKDIYERGIYAFSIEEFSGPDYIMNNYERYKKYFYKE